MNEGRRNNSTRRILEKVRLVPVENRMTEIAAYVNLFGIIEEGIESTFGMREKDALILFLAYELEMALEKADLADELGRTVKGLQLQLGRYKKKAAGVDDKEAA